MLTAMTQSLCIAAGLVRPAHGSKSGPWDRQGSVCLKCLSCFAPQTKANGSPHAFCHPLHSKFQTLPEGGAEGDAGGRRWSRGGRWSHCQLPRGRLGHAQAPRRCTCNIQHRLDQRALEQLQQVQAPDVIRQAYGMCKLLAVIPALHYFISSCQGKMAKASLPPRQPQTSLLAQ